MIILVRPVIYSWHLFVPQTFFSSGLSISTTVCIQQHT
jgi:hypothetical protein